LRFCVGAERCLLWILVAEVPLAVSFRWDNARMMQVWAVGVVLLGITDGLRIWLARLLRNVKMWR
jgi:hypothetical protein